MSAIRPNLPAVLPPQPAGQTPVRAARSDFFKAALDAVQISGAEAPARAPAPASSAAVIEARPTRPGALLDIRV